MSGVIHQTFLPLLSAQTLDRDEDSEMAPTRSPAFSSKQWLPKIHLSSPVPRWRKRRRPGPSECESPSNGKPSSIDVCDVIAAIEAVSNSRREVYPLRPMPLLDFRHNSPPLRPKCSPSRPENSSPISGRLPPLELRMLQRPRLYLPIDGFGSSQEYSHSDPAIVVEEIVQIREQSSDKSSPLSRLEAALRLSALPKKCVPDDEVALMPCHSLAHRGYPILAAELWREPIRDRDKDWRPDELNIILANADVFASRRRRGLGMTLAPSPLNRGKWSRWEIQKLHVKPKAKFEGVSPTKTRQRRQCDGVLLRNHGAMISKTYCLVSIYGVGIVGRLYDAGVSTREQLSLLPVRPEDDTHNSPLLTQGQRFLRLEAYDPITSRVFILRVTLNDLAWAFHERPEFLVAGKKQELLRELIRLLYFEYPNEKAIGVDSLQMRNGDHASSNALQELIDINRTNGALKQGKSALCDALPALRLSQERQLSEATRRRLEREAHLRWEEEQRLLALAAFMKLPRRARHRLACKCVRLHGRTFIVSVYHLPTQVRSFVVIAYHPRSSTTFRLAVGVMEMAALASVLSLPHTWSTELRRSLAESVFPKLRFLGSRVPKLPITSEDSNTGTTQEHSGYSEYRAALAMQDNRAGPWALPGWLPPLEGIRTGEMVRAEVAEKRLRDSRRALELAASLECDRIREQEQSRNSELEQQIAVLDDRRIKLLERDTELVKQIEEIDSRGGASANIVNNEPVGNGNTTTSKGYHELRRAHKAERKHLKAELKSVASQTTEKKREQHLLHEQAQLDIEKQQRRLRRKLEVLANENPSSNVVQKSGADNDCEAELCRASNFSQSRHTQHNAHARVCRALICGPESSLVAAGACQVEHIRFRYSLYALDAAPIFNTVETFRLELYHCSTSSSFALELTRLDWLSLTKSTAHEQQLQIPEFAIVTPGSVAQRIQELESRLVDLRGELSALHIEGSNGTKARKTSTAIAKTMGRRREVAASFSSLSQERRQLSRLAPWNAAVRGLCDRLRPVYQLSTSSEIVRIEIDRCIFRAVLPVISVLTDEDDTTGDDQVTKSGKLSGSDDDQVVDCHVRALLENQELVFEVFDPTSFRQWKILYPDSLELVKEFAGNTFIEQQLHIEAIAMSMILFVDGRTGNAELRFED